MNPTDLKKPPLHLHLLFHPESKEARAFAEKLMERFVEPPASGGLRIPVFFTPDRGDGLPPLLEGSERLDLDAAEHSLVVLLADLRMVRQVSDGVDTGDAWRAFAETLSRRIPLGVTAHHLFAVALDPAGYGITGDRHVVSAVKGDLEQRLSDASLHIAIRAIQLLRQIEIRDLPPEQVKAPIRLFLSHAKADRSKGKEKDKEKEQQEKEEKEQQQEKEQQDPVGHLMDDRNELPVEQWFDSEKIGPGERFAEEIEKGLRDTTVVVAFLTDHYASRPWCRREVLDAKRLGVPILVVDALTTGEPRNFPYLGNLPTLHWDYSASQREGRRVIDRAVRESLRYAHNRAVTGRFAREGDVLLASAPEALTLATHAAGKRFLYPDPPLSEEELALLRAFRPASFETPLTRIAARARSGPVRTLGVSISESDDLERYGLAQAHQQNISDEVHLYLLLAGLCIGYGGALRGAMSNANNFTLRLFELVRGYSDLAKGVAGRSMEPIVNFAPWPLWRDYTDADIALLHGVAKYIPCPRPALQMSDQQLFPHGLDAGTPERRFAWARGLTLMREQMTDEVQARLVVGGKLQPKFSGVHPGVLEEAWMSIKKKRPIFLVGGLGGAARAVIDQLCGRQREEFTTANAALVPHYAQVVDLYRASGAPFVTREQMGEAIQTAGTRGLRRALNNGLTDPENLLLFHAVDPTLIATLVITGMKRLAQSDKNKKGNNP